MHWSQSRLDFDPNRLRALGVRHIYALPGYSTADWFCDQETFNLRLDELSRRKEDVERTFSEMQVHALAYTSCHPEGQTRVPELYQCQQDVAGNRREGFVCLKDTDYIALILERLRRIAGAGFRRLLLDDDFKDTLCFCPLHISDFAARMGVRVVLPELRHVFEDESASEDSISLRREYIAFCRGNVLDLAHKIEQAVHESNPDMRLGTCIPARRFLDLCGLKCDDILRIFGSARAESFARLPGEHYSPLVLDMAASVGYHTYFDSVLPTEYERAWEATVVAAAPYNPKSSRQMAQEGRVCESLGIGPILWAWTEDFAPLNLWSGLTAANQWPGDAAARNADREYLGIPVLVQPCLAHEVSLEEHLTDGAIKGYQALALMGLPMRITDAVRAQDDVICLFGHQGKSVMDMARSWLREGRTVVVDLPAAHKICQYLSAVAAFSLVSLDAAVFEECLISGKRDTAISGLPAGSIASVVGENVRPITRFLSSDGDSLGCAVASVPVEKGRVLILPYDLSQVTHRVPRRLYSEILPRELSCLVSRRLPYLIGDAFLQLVLFREGGQHRYVAINYSDCAVDASLCQAASAGDVIHMEALGLAKS